MDNNSLDKELNDILKECDSFDTDPVVNKRKAAPAKSPKPSHAPTTQTPDKPRRKTLSRPENKVPVESRIYAEMKASKEKKAEERQNAEEQHAIQVQKCALNGEEAPPAPTYKATHKKASFKKAEHQQEKPAKQAQPKPRKEMPTTEQQPMQSAQSKQASAQTAQPVQPRQQSTQSAPSRKAKAEKQPKPKRVKKEKAPKAPKAPKTVKPERNMPGTLRKVLMVCAVLCVVWVGLHIHPDTGSSTGEATEKKLNMAERLNVYMNNAASDALSNLAYIKKVFTIPESDLVAPVPDQSKFGETTDPMEVQKIVDEAAELLDGQDMIWNPDIKFWDGMPIKYYYDETILTIAWKELINGTMYSFCEVKVAHGSQLRRAISENTYGSSVYKYPTEMAKNVNAVVACSADFYTYRDLGITVYQRQLYRHKPASVDTCFFTADGDMVFSRRGELSDKAEAEQFIKDNNIVFSASFGPVVIDNGEKQSWPNYTLGEVEKKYSRNVFSQCDKLHYLMMTSNFEGPGQTPIVLDTAADVLMSKGVEKAYALDGGQTASLVMNNKLINRVDWGNERTMSDIIYFASAVPTKEGE